MNDGTVRTARISSLLIQVAFLKRYIDNSMHIFFVQHNAVYVHKMTRFYQLSFYNDYISIVLRPWLDLFS